ncbi:hypothetical protein [Actinoplanes sp. NPDC049802]|uniref:hypothetical protein n=1 Tax=Actinoplanes sp. NPDC049802 TaxID=3154742 RepID=UPI0033C9BC82
MSGEFTPAGTDPVNHQGLMIALSAGLAFVPVRLQEKLLPAGERPGAALVFHAERSAGHVDGQLILSLGHLSAFAGGLAAFRELLPVDARDQWDANQAEAIRQFRAHLPIGDMKGVWL